MNLVTNGNFQTGDFTGWTNPNDPINNPATISTSGYPTPPGPPYYCAYFYNTGGTTLCGISQTIAVTGSTTYRWTFKSYNVGPTTQGIGWSAISYPSGTGFGTYYTALTVGVWVDLVTNITIPSGDTSLVFGFYNTQGPPLNFPGNVYVDEVSIVAAPVCLHGDTKILAKSIGTGSTEQIPIYRLYPELYRVINYYGKDVPICKNVSSGPITRFVKFEKDFFSKGSPDEKLLTTRGHHILVDGEEKKASRVPGKKIVKTAPQNVYTLILQDRDYVMANNVPVVAFGMTDWNAISSNASIQGFVNMPFGKESTLE